MHALRHRLASRLRALMQESRELNTQTRVAKRAGIGQSTVQRVLTSDQGATVDLLEQLADAFGIADAAYLLLAPDQARLLDRWSRLSATDQQKILAFADVATLPEKAPSDSLTLATGRQAVASKAELLADAPVVRYKIRPSGSPEEHS